MHFVGATVFLERNDRDQGLRPVQGGSKRHRRRTHATYYFSDGCNAAISAFGATAATGDPAKMAAVYAPDGEVVSPDGFDRRTRPAG